MQNLYLAILLPILLVHGCTTQPEPADAIYLGGRVYTASPDMPWAEAMVVRGDELVYVGGNDGATAYQARVTHDLGGRLVLPGLIDGHVHPGFIALYAKLIPLPEAPNREAQLRDIATLIEDNRDQELIFAIGWDNRFFSTEGPHREELDALESKPIVSWEGGRAPGLP